jgi:hypothetical protein
MRTPRDAVVFGRGALRQRQLPKGAASPLRIVRRRESWPRDVAPQMLAVLERIELQRRARSRTTHRVIGLQRRFDHGPNLSPWHDGSLSSRSTRLVIARVAAAHDSVPVGRAGNDLACCTGAARASTRMRRNT